MSKALFISEQTLLDNSIVNENVSYTMIRPTLIKVQEMRIQPIVGSPLYNQIKAQIIASTVSALNQTLLEDYIQPALVQWLQFELPMVLAFKYMNKGMDRRSSTESQPMNVDEITRLMDRTKRSAPSSRRGSSLSAGWRCGARSTSISTVGGRSTASARSITG